MHHARVILLDVSQYTTTPQLTLGNGRWLRLRCQRLRWQEAQVHAASAPLTEANDPDVVQVVRVLGVRELLGHEVRIVRVLRGNVERADAMLIDFQIACKLAALVLFGRDLDLNIDPDTDIKSKSLKLDDRKFRFYLYNSGSKLKVEASCKYDQRDVRQTTTVKFVVVMINHNDSTLSVVKHGQFEIVPGYIFSPQSKHFSKKNQMYKTRFLSTSMFCACL